MDRDRLEARYRTLALSQDAPTRRLAVAQLARLQRSGLPTPEADGPTRALRDLVEQTVGPLHQRPGGDLEGPCPWHASRSGRCLVIFAGGARWWCRSCRRGGDAATWLASVEGVGLNEARRRLGLPIRTTRRRRRPLLRREVLP